MAKQPESNKVEGDAVAPTAKIIEQVEQAGLGPLAWLEFLSDFNSEVLSFLAERVKEDVKTQHSILHCKNADEMRHLQAEFLQNAIEQYTAETGKLVEMGEAAIAQAKTRKDSRT